MSTSDVPIIVALIGLVAAIFGQIHASYSNQREGRRKEYHDYLTGIVKSLIEIRGEIQWAQISVKGLNKDHEKKYVDAANLREAFERLPVALGKAHAIMVSVDDQQIRQWGKAIMQTEEPSEQNALIELSLGRLGDLYGAFKTFKFR